MTTIKKRKGNVDDALQLMDEAELSDSLKDEAIDDFLQEINLLRNLRYVHNAGGVEDDDADTWTPNKYIVLILLQASPHCALVGVFDHCQLPGNDFRANEVQSAGHFQGSNYSRDTHAEKDSDCLCSAVGTGYELSTYLQASRHSSGSQTCESVD